MRKYRRSTRILVLIPPATKRKIRGVARGGWDVNVGLLGIPGCGKSTVGIWIMFELARDLDCYMLAHDPEHALPARLPDGRTTNLVRHATIASAEAACHAGQPGLHAVACLDAAEVVALGNRLGERSLRHFGASNAPPVLVFVDEVANCDEMGPNYLGPILKNALVLRRHRHCGLVWGTQSPMLVHRQFLGKTTELRVFRLNADPDIAHIVKQAGFPQDSAAQIKILKRYEFLRHKPVGFGPEE